MARGAERVKALPPAVLAKLRSRRRHQRQARGAGRRKPLMALLPVPRVVTDAARAFVGVGTRRAAADYVATLDALQREVEDRYDAFLVYSERGVMIYVSADGRWFEDRRGAAVRSDAARGARRLEPERVPTAVVLAARSTGLEGLLDVLPPPPDGASECPACRGTRWTGMATTTGAGEGSFADRVPCRDCGARGWIVDGDR